MVEPGTRGRAAEEMIMRGEAAPDGTRVAFDGAAVLRGDPELLEPHALAVEHAENIVIGNDEERRRIRKGLVLCVPAGIRVAMRRDDGQVPYLPIESARHLASAGIDRKQPVRVDQHGVLPWHLSQALFRPVPSTSLSKP
jgi:hypothetical protein